jgi:hypothetical protein
MIRKISLATFVSAFACVSAFAADFNGKWKAQFDTQWGVQNYTYNFQVDGTKLTGKAVNDLGETNITEGKIDGDNISFVETLSFNGMEIRIAYSGKIAGDEIKFTRHVGEFATQELVAKRVK